MTGIAVKVSASGRMTLPPEAREALGLKGAGHVVITMDAGTLTMRTMAQTLEQVRALARPYAPKSGLASEDPIAERRAEPKRMDVRMGRWASCRAASGWPR